ncbi:ABC transporter ATP-binding protein [Thalassospira mesophila]|uniref:Sulfonate ABC transporter ATP-binding protein n=1 Tax=Thalassospira mesophila TaxID=1293891 RepID=A0A1Y2KUM4_9PROT|nr:ABC transporter ATP-binding protein [Thalassospira mesophila]OSQ35020.1 sulfonate ABC transporter ATP-binding protein [Thalassospira mesophila]
MAHLEVCNISKSFRTSGGVEFARALDGVSFAVEKGEIVALIGPSGSGKTTALRIIMGLESASSGEVRVAGRAISGCGYDRGMVFQHAELLPWRNTLSNIGYGLEMKGVKEPERSRIASHFLELVGLGHARDRRPHQLSGGMKQRAGIARALAIDPEVLLMDEPFGALDSQTRESLHGELLAIHAKTGKTIIIVTHDLDEAVMLADRVVVLKGGQVDQIVTVELDRSSSEPGMVRATDEYARKRAVLWDALHGDTPLETAQ